MNAKRYLKASLFLPIALPILAYAIRSIWNILNGDAAGLITGPDWLAFIEVHLYFSLLIGGIPYLVLLVLAWICISRCSENSFILLILSSPFLVLVIFSLLSLLILAILKPEGFSDLILKMWAPILYVGYAYVLIVLLIYGLGRLSGIIKMPSD